MRIDTHLHFWRPECGFDNRPVADDAAYRRDFLPAHVGAALDRCGIDGVIVVQTAPQVEETQWLLTLVEHEPKVLGVTGWVDLDAPEIDWASCAAETRLLGIRAQLRRIAADDFVARPAVVRNLAGALDAGLAVTLLAEQRHHRHVLAVLETLPAGPITLNHLGLPVPSVERAQWRAAMRGYAHRQDLYVQLSGLPFLFAERWREPDAMSVLDDALDLFGPDRLMFASDWPMMVRVATYDDWVTAVEDFFDRRGLSASDAHAIFAGNAARAQPRLGSPGTPVAGTRGTATAAPVHRAPT